MAVPAGAVLAEPQRRGGVAVLACPAGMEYGRTMLRCQAETLEEPELSVPPE